MNRVQIEKSQLYISSENNFVWKYILAVIKFYNQEFCQVKKNDNSQINPDALEYFEIINEFPEEQ